MTEQESTSTLREVAESLLATQKMFGEDIADMATAVTELSITGERLAGALSNVDELKRAVEQLGETVVAYTGKLGALFDSMHDLNERFGRYVQDAAKQQSGVRDVDRRLQLLEANGGARNGQR
jgi:ABC-type transporter Mla subunit MlaD